MRILVTGAHGYIGRKLQEYVSTQTDHVVERLEVRTNIWKEKDFSCFDAVVHAAGLVHRSAQSATHEDYQRINCDLTIQIAEKAKREGVKHFLFISSASVYGIVEGVIHKDTLPNPQNDYGKTKLDAENALRGLHELSFVVTILRLPMVYGTGCKGNYQQLVKLARFAPVFAAYHNRRSLISIENLTRTMCNFLENPVGGIFFLQDPQYVSTCDLIADIARGNGKKIHLTKFLNPVIWILKATTLQGRKAFGDFIFAEKDCCIERFG